MRSADLFDEVLGSCDGQIDWIVPLQRDDETTDPIPAVDLCEYVHRSLQFAGNDLGIEFELTRESLQELFLSEGEQLQRIIPAEFCNGSPGPDRIDLGL